MKARRASRFEQQGGESPPGAATTKATLDEAMAAYDALPRTVRLALDESSFKISPVGWVLPLAEFGANAVAAAIREQDGAMWRQLMAKHGAGPETYPPRVYLDSR